MRNETLRDLYVDQLRDLHSAETQLTVALPEMAQAASDAQLRAGFEAHLEQTRGHLFRVEKLLEVLGESPAGKTCAAMQGLIQEGREAASDNDPGPVRDAALIAAAQRVEHYEIAAYGTLVRFAQVLGMDDHAETLRTTENEEKHTDQNLTQVAGQVNAAARRTRRE